MPATASSGYSGTPLAKKLGIKAGLRLVTIDAPANYRSLLAPLPAGVKFVRSAGATTALVHLFVTDAKVLARQLEALRGKLAADAALWVSWPKQASKLPTTVNENVIRDLALPLGFVDIKVCAVDATWSALKLVVRKALR